MLGTEGIGDRVEGRGDTGLVSVGVLVRDSVLDVESLDLGESAGGGSVGGDELGHNGERLGGIEDHAGTVEGLVSHTVGVEITSIGIADTAVSAGVTTSISSAGGLADYRAGMRGVGGRDAVGLPDIHFRAAYIWC